MHKAMSTSYADQVVGSFREQVMKNYELDTEIVDTLCKFVRDALEAVPQPTVAKRKPRAKAGATAVSTTDSVQSAVTQVAGSVSAVNAVAPKRRNKSGYNLYVQQMMIDERVKSLKHTEKMAEIGRLWKALSDDEKGKFKTLADVANSADELASNATNSTAPVASA